MLTNNFYAALQCAMTKASKDKAVTKPDGTKGYASYCTNFLSSFFEFFNNKTVVTLMGGRGVAFGTGATPPTPNDYQLSGEIIPTISIVASTITVNIADDGYMYKNAMTISNSGDSPIVINEMALCMSIYQDNYSSYGVVADRTVLDTPLTLAPGEQGVITYTFNLPIVQ